MTALVEVHSEAELKDALHSGARVIGINNRNLKDFTVDLNTTLGLRPLIPPGILVISESGISNREQSGTLRTAGVNAILVGEALMTSAKPEDKIRELLGIQD
jgi:indole-3-glycerol phosphate synthase